MPLPLALEVRIPTPSQDQVLPTLAAALNHLAVTPLIPTHDHHRIQEEAERRVGAVILGQGHVVIPAQGQGRMALPAHASGLTLSLVFP